MSPKRSPFQWVADGAEGVAHEPQPRPDRRGAREEGAALKELAIGLSRLPPERRAALTLDPDVRAQLEALAALPQDGAWQRQIRRVATLLRGEDVDELQAVLAGKGPQDAFAQAGKAWLRRLLPSGDDALQPLLDLHSSLDRQQLRTLLRQARTEGEAGQKARRRFVELLAEARVEPPEAPEAPDAPDAPAS